MVVLITGAKGLLGTYLCKELNRDYTLIEWDLPDFDITQVDRTMTRIKEVSPDKIIHLAAFTDVDGCEIDKEKAYRVNVIGTWAVVMGALSSGADLFFLSSDYVFDGKKGEPYLEYDQVNPINHYGKTKLSGERIIQSHLSKFFIIRSSGLYGKGGRNFVDTIIEKSKKEKILKIVEDQVTSPTYAKDLAIFMKRLINTRYYGIHHFANPEGCSWYDFALEIKNIRNLNAEIDSISSEELGRPAKRPEYSVLNSSLLFEKPRDWREALRDYLKGG